MTLTPHPQNGYLDSTALGPVTDSWTYSGFGEPETYTASVSGSPVLAVTYTRDKLGRITGKTETVLGVTRVFTYGYDLAGRLEWVQTDGVETARYTYDGNGNRLTYTGVLGNAFGTYDDQDRLLNYGGATFTYTNNGELATKTDGSQVTTYDYDASGNLRTVVLPDGTQIDYVIDGQNRRVGKKVNGVLVQDQLEPVAELDGAGNIVSRFVYASRANTPDYMIKGGVTYRIISDHLGSPRLVINTADGAIAQQLDYDEFGNILLDTNPGFQPFGFAGGLWDATTELICFGTRDYAPESGSWTTADSILFLGRSTNLYAYVPDPVNRYDPSGTLDFSVSVHYLPPGQLQNQRGNNTVPSYTDTSDKGVEFDCRQDSCGKWSLHRRVWAHVHIYLPLPGTFTPAYSCYLEVHEEAHAVAQHKVASLADAMAKRAEKSGECKFTSKSECEAAAAVFSGAIKAAVFAPYFFDNAAIELWSMPIQPFVEPRVR